MHTIPQGTTTPLRALLRDDDKKSPLKLSLADEVRFSMRHAGEGPVVVTLGLCTIAPDVGDEPDDGIVGYPWALGQTDEPDTYEAEWTVTWLDGRVQRVPNEGFYLIRIRPKVV